MDLNQAFHGDHGDMGLNDQKTDSSPFRGTFITPCWDSPKVPGFWLTAILGDIAEWTIPHKSPMMTLLSNMSWKFPHLVRCCSSVFRLKIHETLGISQLAVLFAEGYNYDRSEPAGRLLPDFEFPVWWLSVPLAAPWLAGKSTSHN